MYWQCPNCDKKAKTVKELRKLGCICKSQPLEMTETSYISKTKSKTKEEDGRSTSKKVHDFAMSRIKKIIISENNSDEVYAIVENNGHVESLNLGSKRARQWIYDQYSRNVESNDIHSDDFFKTVTDAIIARAQMNGTERARTHNRIAQSENQILYDLGTPDWKILKITPSGMETVGFDVTMPLFQRRQSLQMQEMPKEGDGRELDELAVLLHILDDDKIVFIVHTICMFLESCSVPIMVFDGSAGSLKTTDTATIKRIIDPSGKVADDNVSAMAEKDDDLIIQLNNRYLPSFDNVSFIKQNTSDILCRAITGSGNMRRKKYSDDNEVIHNFRRKIVLNGIIPTLDYPDLQTRILNYPRKPVDENNRITEQEFNERLEQLLPGLLAKIFNTLSKALKRYPELNNKIRPKTRMADFEIWGEIISRVLGYQENVFLDLYYKKLNEGNVSSLDQYPIVTCIQSFMENKDIYENTAHSLYNELVTIAKDEGIDLNSRSVRFPKAPNKLKKDVVMTETFLRSMGFSVEMYHYSKNDGKFKKNASIIKISRRNKQASLDDISKVSSPSSPVDDLVIKSGEDSGEDTMPSIGVSSPEKAEFTHEIKTGGDGEDSKDTQERFSGQQFYCKTHKAGPWLIDAPGSAGLKIIDFHKNQGCEIEFTEGQK